MDAAKRWTAVLLVGLVGLLGCDRHERQEEAKATPPVASAKLSPFSPLGTGSANAAAPRPETGPAVIAHGGVGSPSSRSAAVLPAVQRAFEKLKGGGATLDAAVTGAVVLEDDPGFNAGTGANVRFDGKTVQMDAAVMSSAGQFGAVAVIEDVKNPVLVARRVVDSPHTLIAGDGATAFARVAGFAPFDPSTEAAHHKQQRALATLRGEADAGLPPGWKNFDWKAHYDYQQKLADAGLQSSDTIAVLTRGADGSFAGAISTGGTTLTLRGRVGDVPLQGAGLYVGTAGAVAATGNGEDIVREMLSRRVYEKLAEGETLAAALAWGIGLFERERVAIGLIALSPEGSHAAANRSMAWAAKGAGGERLAK